jgi:hypothetical protein
MWSILSPYDLPHDIPALFSIVANNTGRSFMAFSSEEWIFKNGLFQLENLPMLPNIH